MYKRILVPLDGSPLAEGILPVVDQLATALPSRLELLSIVDQEAANASLGSIQGEVVRDRNAVVRMATMYVRGVAARLKAQVDAQAVPAQGTVPDQILREAEKVPSTLIAMSTHGRSGITRFVMGSVAHKVLYATSQPMLLWRRRDDDQKQVRPLESVVVPLDGSAVAETVIPHVKALAKALHFKVYLARVTPTYADYFGASPYYPAEIVVDMQRETREYLARKVSEFKEAGIVDVESYETLGGAAPGIIEFTRSSGASLVAICTHGRSGIGRWVLGSVAENLVISSGTPVLIVRPDSSKAQS